MQGEKRALAGGEPLQKWLRIEWSEARFFLTDMRIELAGPCRQRLLSLVAGKRRLFVGVYCAEGERVIASAQGSFSRSTGNARGNIRARGQDRDRRAASN